MHMEYHYSPRAGMEDARNPPIPFHFFHYASQACASPCSSQLPHSCSAPRRCTTFLPRIPKRTRDFTAEEDVPIWGLEAIYSPSALRVFVYHSLVVIGPIAFWVWWLIRYPNDYQNAAIPIMAVLGLISVFWTIYMYTSASQYDVDSFAMKNK